MFQVNNSSGRSIRKNLDVLNAYEFANNTSKSGTDCFVVNSDNGIVMRHYSQDFVENKPERGNGRKTKNWKTIGA